MATLIVVTVIGLILTCLIVLVKHYLSWDKDTQRDFWIIYLVLFITGVLEALAEHFHK